MSYFTNKLKDISIDNDKVNAKANKKIAGLNIFLPKKAKNTPITTNTVVKIIGLFSINLKSWLKLNLGHALLVLTLITKVSFILLLVF